MPINGWQKHCTPHVLIISTRVDIATDAVTESLRRKSVSYTRIDTDLYPYHMSTGTIIGEGGAVRIDIGGETITPTSVWYRRQRSPEIPSGMDAGIHEYCIKEGYVATQSLGHIPPVRRVMSSPSAINRAENKIVQLSTASSLELTIPQTCISNDPALVTSFIRKFDRVICKPLRSGWYEDSEGQWSIYTTEIGEEEMMHIDDVRYAPCIFQPLIEKSCDVRVTVVGGKIFAAEIHSQGDEDARVDWRRTRNPNLPHRNLSLPGKIAEKLLRLMRELQLEFGAIDMVKTPEGEYVFLEVNPNGQWIWLDDQLELGITDAVADWLSGV